MKRLAGNVTLTIASVGFALVLAEILLRLIGFSHVVFFRPDPVTGSAHIAGAEGWWTSEGRSYVRITTRGWRDKERPFQKPAGVFRIAVLGDSYMEALQVPQDSAVPALLERTLNDSLPGRFEVLNFGVSGYGTGQELLVLQHYALDYAPDAVILAFTVGNDVSDNSRALKPGANVPFFRLVDRRLVLDTSFLASPRYRSPASWRAQTLRFLGQHSRVAQLLRYAQFLTQVARAKQALGDPARGELNMPTAVYLNPPPDSLWTQAWNVTERLISLMNQECRSHNIPFYLVSLSSSVQVTPDTARRRALAAELGVPDLFEPERRLERLSVREGFDALALAPLLASRAIATHEYYHGVGERLGKGHWNERGHRVAASLLRAWLAVRLPRDLGSR